MGHRAAIEQPWAGLPLAVVAWAVVSGAETRAVGRQCGPLPYGYDTLPYRYEQRQSQEVEVQLAEVVRAAVSGGVSVRAVAAEVQQTGVKKSPTKAETCSHQP